MFRCIRYILCRIWGDIEIESYLPPYPNKLLKYLSVLSTKYWQINGYLKCCQSGKLWLFRVHKYFFPSVGNPLHHDGLKVLSFRQVSVAQRWILLSVIYIAIYSFMFLLIAGEAEKSIKFKILRIPFSSNFWECMVSFGALYYAFFLLFYLFTWVGIDPKPLCL